jgi:hypothetical protein
MLMSPASTVRRLQFLLKNSAHSLTVTVDNASTEYLTSLERLIEDGTLHPKHPSRIATPVESLQRRPHVCVPLFT